VASLSAFEIDVDAAHFIFLLHFSVAEFIVSSHNLRICLWPLNSTDNLAILVGSDMKEAMYYEVLCIQLYILNNL
jgi:hypothetical protein